MKISKAAIARAALLLLFVPATSPAGDDDWFGQDKFLHGGASALIDSTCYWTLREGVGLRKDSSLAVSAAATLSLGVAKELADATFSAKDLVWDVIGTGLGTIVWAIVDRRNDRVAVTISSSFAGVEYFRRF